MGFPHFLKSNKWQAHNDSCSSIHHHQVQGCTNSQQGREFLHYNAVKTGLLNPPHTSVPWLTVNGVHTPQIESAMEQDTLGYVCSVYQGDKPKACSKYQ